ncbi:MAG: hypothetical protein ABI557_05655 [Aureliella sp.]
MNRFVSLLLIPFFVLGQALPHSHAGTSVEQTNDHASRPHVHLSSDHSHDLHHAETSHHHNGEVDYFDSANAAGTSVSSPPFSHDADAIYLAASTSLASRVVATQKIYWASDEVIVDCLFKLAAVPKAGGRVAPPERCASVPIYLLVSSLRI